MTDDNKTNSRNAVFIGRLFLNVSKTGKKYFKGKINDQDVFGHIKDVPRKDNPNETYKVVNIELVTNIESKPVAADDVF